MAKSGDVESLKNWLSSIRIWHLVIIAALVGGLIGLHILKGMSFSKIDRTDYKAVGEDFVKNNPRIARELGKIKSVKLLGAGGGGKTSYNSYSVRGEDKSGMCHVTLVSRDGLWYVKSVTLIVGGAEYDIPVSRQEEKRRIRIFGR